MAGCTLDELGITDGLIPTHVSIKESVFPFSKFPGVDTLLGPEMRSTGEVMGVATAMSLAFAKSTSAAGMVLPDRGQVFISVRDEDKPAICHVARRLRNIGFQIVATDGTARAIAKARIPVERVNKVIEGSPHVVDAINAGRIQIVINTTQGAQAIRDSYSIRRHTLLSRIAYFTTVEAALALTDALEARHLLGGRVAPVRSVQEWHARAAR
jgi:carbamoyl-phosphate synthase large subunit